MSNGLDERRIQEIVERVVARLGSDLPASPAEAVERAAARQSTARPYSPPSSDGGGARRELRIPRGNRDRRAHV